MKHIYVIFLLIGLTLLQARFFFVHAQEIDSLKAKRLDEVVVIGVRSNIGPVKRLEPVHETYITVGKKNEVIMVQDLPANLAEKSGRQIFAKVPGVFIYDMDGSGNQMNISTRGLDPHRGWEYNIRQNGVMTNSDIYGYPASHYSPPMESIQQIELIRGTSSLQYGAEFGGMINYKVKEADTTRKVGFESINTVGSFGLQSTYNAIGGKTGKFTYYGYYHRRVSEGYRENSRSEAEAQYFNLKYTFSERLEIKAELGRSTYLYQIPGPLTDSLHAADPRQSTRSRNYFSPDIYVPSLSLDWTFGDRIKLNWVTSAVLGQRNSLQFVGLADVADEIDPDTNAYPPRQVDRDNFNSYASELRLRKDYRINQMENTLIVGLRYANNDMHRRQQGRGTTGVDYNLTLIQPGFGRDLHYKTQGISVFAENLFRLSPRLSVSPGIRIENAESRMSGKVVYLPDEEVPLHLSHKFTLLGISGEFALNKSNAIYGGWSQAYRPIVMADIIPPTSLDRTDENLKDSFGANAELGIRGEIKNLSYDLSFFQVAYNNRVGHLILSDAQNQPYIFKTNTGNSRTNGLELYVEYGLIEREWTGLSLFTSTSYFDAQYLEGELRDGADNRNITGNRLETVPRWMSRNGFQIMYKGFSGVGQFSYVDKSYSDAFNTLVPSENGAKGVVPSYALFDWNMSYRFMPNLLLKVGINNVTNKQYFTKRPSGYPGAGVWSSDGRSINVTVGIKL